jgi:hypothetical protein
MTQPKIVYATSADTELATLFLESLHDSYGKAPITVISTRPLPTSMQAFAAEDSRVINESTKELIQAIAEAGATHFATTYRLSFSLFRLLRHLVVGSYEQELVSIHEFLDENRIQVLHPHHVDAGRFQGVWHRPTPQEHDIVFAELCRALEDIEKLQPFEHKNQGAMESILVRIAGGTKYEGDIRKERWGTDNLISSADKLRRSPEDQIVLYKRSFAEYGNLVHPVIGERTLELCHHHGISHIVVDAATVVVHPQRCLMLARKFGITLRGLPDSDYPAAPSTWSLPGGGST